MPAMTGLLLECVPVARAGLASGVLNTGRQLGGALAVAVFGSLIAGAVRLEQGMQLSLLFGCGTPRRHGCGDTSSPYAEDGLSTADLPPEPARGDWQTPRRAMPLTALQAEPADGCLDSGPAVRH